MKELLQMRLPENELSALKAIIPVGSTQSTYLRGIFHTYLADKKAIQEVVCSFIEEIYNEETEGDQRVRGEEGQTDA